MNFCKRCDPANHPVWRPGEAPDDREAPDPLDCRTEHVLCAAGGRAADEFLDGVAQRRRAVGTIFRDEDFPGADASASPAGASQKADGDG